jgi:ketosteroid isomerase-like protein
MSQENIEIVRAVHPPSGTDLSHMFAEVSRTVELFEPVSGHFHPDFESVGGDPTVGPGLSAGGIGMAGLAEMWREWMEPWDVYWTEVEDVIDTDDDRVLVLIRDRGRLRGSSAEVEQMGASVWTLRDSRIARVEFHSTRDSARRAAGLLE